MASGFNVWDVNEDIIFEIIASHPNVGTGLTGQVPYITLTIQRDLDGKFWSGSTWLVTPTSLSVTEVDSVVHPGRYTYTLIGATGNIVATRYVGHVNINNPNPPVLQADDYEFHVSRVVDINVYESEPA